MDSKEGLELVKRYVEDKKIIKHLIASGKAMEKLAQKKGEDKELWKLAGILHDIDYGMTTYLGKPDQHGILGAKMLEKMGLEHSITSAIIAHTGSVERKTLLDKALFIVDPLTRLIIKATLAHPSKKIREVDVSYVIKCLDKIDFASEKDLKHINSCERLGLSLEEVVEITLKGMQEISEELDL